MENEKIVVVEATCLTIPTRVVGPRGAQHGEPGDYLARCADGSMRIIGPEDWDDVSYAS